MIQSNEANWTYNELSRRKNTVRNGSVTKEERNEIQLSCSDEENKW